MIIQKNYAPSALPKGIDIGALTGQVIGPLTAIVERAGLDGEQAAALRVHLDWIQYKTSFRDPVAVRSAGSAIAKSRSRSNFARSRAAR